MGNAAYELDRFGRAWFRAVLDNNDLEPLDALGTPGGPGTRIGTTKFDSSVIGNNGSLAGVLSQLQQGMRAVRLVMFNKTPECNWGVPWHQDRTITVQKKANVQEFRNWSRKAGVWHCEPPERILESMLFVRIHLDDVDVTGGAMEVALGSHRAGVVAAADAERVAADCDTEICTAKRGDVLVLKMLMLHRSKPAVHAAARRVVRIDYASADLPHPLDWSA